MAKKILNLNKLKYANFSKTRRDRENRKLDSELA